MKLVNSKVMRSIDARSIKDFGTKGLVLMENAGAGVARVARDFIKENPSLFPDASPGKISIVTGKGNNGGDGFVAARHLKNAGFEVQVFTLAEAQDIKGDAKTNLLIWQKMGGGTYPVNSLKGAEKHALAFRHSGLIIDAIFGTGTTKDVTGLYASVIDIINKVGKPVLSVDVPSGISATTGRVLGRGVRATITATLALPKLGLYLYPGRDFAGTIKVIDIGMPKELLLDSAIKWHLTTEEMVRSLLKPRKRNTHKGSYGHVLSIGGSTGKSGAIYLSAMGAMRIGAGLATIALPASLNQAMEAKTTEIMTAPLPDNKEGFISPMALSVALGLIKGKDAVVIGPGLGDVGCDFVLGVINACVDEDIPVVVDADALNCFKGDCKALKKSSENGAQVVLTPHPGEAARLLGRLVTEVQADRIGSAEELAKKTNATILLKGPSSITVTGEHQASREVFINPTGGPALASAGTGDVLAGMIAGLLAEGLTIAEASISAPFLHGMAADMLSAEMGEAGMIASDLFTILPPLLSSYTTEASD